MNKLIPDFIAKKFSQGLTEGSFQGAALFLDISGFTKLTEKYLEKGKEGAESLTGIINKLFSEIINKIYMQQGFVTTFAGDALTAVFPAGEGLTSEEVCRNALYSAQSICNFIVGQNLRDFEGNTYWLSLKIGISFGSIEWGIGGNPLKIYWFKGKTIESCALAEKLATPMEIITDQEFFQILYPDQTPNLTKYHKFKTNETIIQPTVKASTDIAGMPVQREVQLNFQPDYLTDNQFIGEFRDIVIVFVNFQETRLRLDFQEFIQLLLTTGRETGGFIDCLDFGDKGNNSLIYFGAPISYENNLLRAVNFAETLKRESKIPLRIGITTGTVLAWMLGNQTQAAYACLGSSVNLAARMMMEAQWNQILVTQTIYQNLNKMYLFASLGEALFKGYQKPVDLYELIRKESHLFRQCKHAKLIGRDKELAILQDLYSDLNTAGSTRIVYIYGSAGMGKTCLVDSFLSELEDQPEICFIKGDSILNKSLQPFSQLLETYLELSQNQDEKVRKEIFELNFQKLVECDSKEHTELSKYAQNLRQTKSFLAELLHIKTEDSLYTQLDPQSRFNNTVFALRDFLLYLSTRKNLILVVDDLQWLDKDSRFVLQVLLRVLPKHAILLLVTARIEDSSAKIVLPLEDDLASVEIDLNKLSDTSITELITGIFGQIPGEELFRFLETKTKGNPFYLEQYCYFLKENNFIRQGKKEVELLLNPTELPSSVNQTIVARIDRLSQQLKNIVQIASVLGQEFDIRILRSILQTFQNLNFAQNPDLQLSEGIKERIWSVYSEIKYIFSHALLRDSAYEMQLRTRLKEIHRFAAKTIEEYYPQNSDYFFDLGYHYENAGDLEHAGKYFEFAVEKALDNYQNHFALTCLEKVVLFTKDLNKKLNMNFKRASIYCLMGKREEELAIIKENLAPAQENKLLEWEIRYKSQLGAHLEKYGEMQQGIEVLKEALGMLTEEIKTKSPFIYARLASALGSIYFKLGDLEQAKEYFLEDMRVSDASDDSYGFQRAMTNLGVIHGYKGEFDKSLECFMAYATKNRKLNKADECILYGNVAQTYGMMGDFVNAKEYMTKQMDLSIEIGDRAGLCSALGNFAIYYHYQQDYEKSLDSFDQWEQTALEMGNKMSAADAVANKGQVYATMGKWDEAIACFQKKKEVSLALGDIYGGYRALTAIADYYVHKQEISLALSSYLEAEQKAQMIANPKVYVEARDFTADLYYQMWKEEPQEEYRLGALERYEAINSDGKYDEKIRELVVSC